MEREHMTLHLTLNQKKRFAPILTIRDDPKNCFYCMKPFTDTNPRVWEHLDNDDTHNYPENLVWSHHSCNVKKRMDDKMLAKAQGKLTMNIQSDLFTSAGTLADTGTTKDTTSQQEISKCNNRITKQFLLEHTINDELLLKDAVNAIVDICQDNNDTGSQSAVYRYIDSLTNPYTGKYTLSVNSKGQNIIRRRTEN